MPFNTDIRNKREILFMPFFHSNLIETSCRRMIVGPVDVSGNPTLNNAFDDIFCAAKLFSNIFRGGVDQTLEHEIFIRNGHLSCRIHPVWPQRGRFVVTIDAHETGPLHVYEYSTVQNREMLDDRFLAVAVRLGDGLATPRTTSASCRAGSIEVIIP